MGPPGRSKRPSGCFFPESWLSTPSLKEPRPSPSTPAPSKWCARRLVCGCRPQPPHHFYHHPKGPFQGCHNLTKECLPSLLFFLFFVFLTSFVFLCVCVCVCVWLL